MPFESKSLKSLVIKVDDYQIKPQANGGYDLHLEISGQEKLLGEILAGQARKKSTLTQDTANEFSAELISGPAGEKLSLPWQGLNLQEKAPEPGPLMHICLDMAGQTILRLPYRPQAGGQIPGEKQRPSL